MNSIFIFLPRIYFLSISLIFCSAFMAEAKIRIVTQTLPDGTVDVPYSATIETVGAKGQVTFSVSAGTLPDGLSLNENTGEINGIPINQGTFIATYTATDSTSNGSVALGIKILEKTYLVKFIVLNNGSLFGETPQTIGHGLDCQPVTAVPDPGYIFDRWTGNCSSKKNLLKITNVVQNMNVLAEFMAEPQQSSFVTSSFMNGTTGIPYYSQLETQYAAGTVIYAIQSGTIPQGLTLDTVSGIIPGKLLLAGVSDLTISANDTASTIYLADTITVSDPSPGIFRFLTKSLPEGSTNGEYSAYLITANSKGTITFAISEGNLPNGLTINSANGLISGLPTKVGQFNVTFSANDGIDTITLPLVMKITASGGGGNSGASISNIELSTGRIGAEYMEIITVQNGIGPFIYCADGIPAGLSLNGLNGTISGIPKEAGTFNVTFSVTDTGENNNKIIKILSIKIFPSSSNFSFETSMLANGEIGSIYSDTWKVSGNNGSVKFSSSGLPSGLSVNTDTGVVSGIPEESGKFLVILSATDSSDSISLNLPIIIAPSATSNMFWSISGLPAALYGVEYGRQPPILASAENGNSVTYSAIGLPQGISYNSITGELSGVTLEIGIFPVRFIANDSLTGETIIFRPDFIVLPESGGDIKDLAVNLWIKSQQIKSGTSGKDSLNATFIYNADRRTGKAFDPSKDSFELSAGSKTILLPPGSFLTAKNGTMSYKTPKESKAPKISAMINPNKQTIQIATKNDTITESFPSETRETLIIGGKSYRLDLHSNQKGKLEVTFGYRSNCLVCSNLSFYVKGAGTDFASLDLFYTDPGFSFATKNNLTIKVNNGNKVLFEKDLTDFLETKTTWDKNKEVFVYSIKNKFKDTATTNQLKQFSYNSKSGKMTFKFACLTLGGLLNPENHISVEIGIKDKKYFTTVSAFETKTGSGKYGIKKNLNL